MKAEVIARLHKRRITPDPKGGLYLLRYASQNPEERRSLSWHDLVDELTLHAIQYGIDTIDDNAFIEMAS